MRARFAFVTLSAALATGCATPPTSPRVEAGPRTISSKFDAATITTGQRMAWEKNWGLGIVDRMTAELAVVRDNASGRADVGAVFTIDYSAKTWRFYSSASLDDAQQVRATKISRDVRGCYRGECSYREAVSVLLPARISRRAGLGLRDAHERGQRAGGRHQVRSAARRERACDRRSAVGSASIPQPIKPAASRAFSRPWVRG
jgi:hypothetical protein